MMSCVPLRDRDARERFALFELRGDDPLRADVLEGRKRHLLHGTRIRRHEDVVFVVEPLDREDEGKAFVLFQGKQIDDGATARARLPFGEVEDVDRIDPSGRREAKQNVVRIRNKELLDFVVLRRRLHVAALAAARLRRGSRRDPGSSRSLRA